MSLPPSASPLPQTTVIPPSPSTSTSPPLQMTAMAPAPSASSPQSAMIHPPSTAGLSSSAKTPPLPPDGSFAATQHISLLSLDNPASEPGELVRQDQLHLHNADINDNDATNHMQMIVASKNFREYIRNFKVPDDQMAFYDQYGSLEPAPEVSEFQQVMYHRCKNGCPIVNDENDIVHGFLEYYCVNENRGYCIECAHLRHDDETSPYSGHTLYRQTQPCAFPECRAAAQVRCEDCDGTLPNGLLLCSDHAAGMHQRGDLIYHSPMVMTLKEQYMPSCQKVDSVLESHFNDEVATISPISEMAEPESERPKRRNSKIIRGPKSMTLLANADIPVESDMESENSSLYVEKKKNRKPGRPSKAITHKPRKRVRPPSSRLILGIKLDNHSTEHTEVEPIRRHINAIVDTMHDLGQSTPADPSLVPKLQDHARQISGLLQTTGLLHDASNSSDDIQVTIPDYVTYTNVIVNSNDMNVSPIKQLVPQWIQDAPSQICSILGNTCSTRYQKCKDVHGLFGPDNEVQSQCVVFFGPTYMCNVAARLLALTIKIAEALLDVQRSALKHEEKSGLQPNEQIGIRHGAVSGLLAVIRHTVKEDLGRAGVSFSQDTSPPLGTAMLDCQERDHGFKSAMAPAAIPIKEPTQNLFWTGFDIITAPLGLATAAAKLTYLNDSLAPMWGNTNIARSERELRLVRERMVLSSERQHQDNALLEQDEEEDRVPVHELQTPVLPTRSYQIQDDIISYGDANEAIEEEA